MNLIIITGHVEVVQGEWAVDHSAGGSRNNLQMFAKNPQYLLTLTEPGLFLYYTPDRNMYCHMMSRLKVI